MGAGLGGWCCVPSGTSCKGGVAWTASHGAVACECCMPSCTSGIPAVPHPTSSDASPSSHDLMCHSRPALARVVPAASSSAQHPPASSCHTSWRSASGTPFLARDLSLPGCRWLNSRKLPPAGPSMRSHLPVRRCSLCAAHAPHVHLITVLKLSWLCASMWYIVHLPCMDATCHRMP